MISLSNYLILSSIIFCIGMAGIFINRTNVITLLMCVELILLAVNTNFVAFSYYLSDTAGQIFVFFILTVAAAEVVLGLVILVLLFRRRHSVSIDVTNSLKG
ncbi:NADH-ubiquinone oxidoreductase chain K [hydrothermal vent metagenome]|uniref:NADH-ubiquinone oxidoreductase chain K n=1 Tax=hydrothermal vent metagenome TaxID=652676 RepID=A0A1W1CBX9_9ZZZZ